MQTGRVLLRRAAIVVFALGLTGPSQAADRSHGGNYSPERLAQVRSNVARLAWAGAICDRTVQAAASWVARSDEELWAMVPGQDLPRCIDVTLTRLAGGTTRAGCLNCGKEIDRFGTYPYEPDFDRLPWKLTCPACGVVFPTNDFGAYYRSGLDDRGLFEPDRADRALLYNFAHPDPRDPLHRYGVDDGFGYTDQNGQEHRYIGYYTWKYWRHILDGLHALAQAFIYTGETRYAHKAAILLDRIADVYPDMDWAPYARRGWYHSDANRGVGKIEGAIWETNLASKLAECSDAILSGTVDDDALFRFLAERGRSHRLPRPKGSRELFVRNLDDRLLRAMHDAVLDGRISGNEGMQQMTMATAALALNKAPETNEWLDWLFAPRGGAMPGFIVGQMDRDGGSSEAAPGYAMFAGIMFSRIAAKLHDYPGYQGPDMFREYPQLRASFLLGPRLAALGRAVPNLGDSGATGLVTTKPADPTITFMGYCYTGDPAMAVAAVRLNGGKVRPLVEDAFMADPEELAGKVEALARAAGPRPVGGSLLSGYGLALLEVGRGAGETALVCNYGRTLFHGHADMLNFDLLAFGRWLAPDLGYPEFATNWPSRDEWTSNTLAHNTVFFDGRPQQRGWGGRARLFRQLSGVAAVEIDGLSAYPNLQEYTRTLLLIEAPGGHGAYAVDVFRVRGGKDQVLSFHGPPGDITVSGLALVPQSTGTYAGPQVPPFAKTEGMPTGYSYLYDVRRDVRPAGAFKVDWRVAAGYRGTTESENLHIRLHALSASDDVALAHGDPPQNKEGNPRSLTYLLQHRAGAEPAGPFVGVLEPYRGQPLLKSVQRLAAGSAEQVLLRIEWMTGEVDQVCVNRGEHDRMEVDDLKLRGKLAFVRRRADGAMERATLLAGFELQAGDVHLHDTAVLTGRVVRMNRELAGGGLIWVDTRLPDDGSLNGLPIHMASSSERDATYIIQGVRREDDGLTRIDCGEITFVRGFDSPMITLRGQTLPEDYSRGYTYDFEPGAAFRIPLHTEWRRAGSVAADH